MSGITYDMVKELFSYENGCLYWAISKQGVRLGDRVGVEFTNGYRYVRINYKRYLEHRIIFLWHHGYLPETVDHINGTPNDNRIDNLRAATFSQNMRNQKLSSRNKHGLKGVHFNKQKLKYQANIAVEGKSKFLGFFDTPEEAHIAYCNAADMLHGEFANYGG